MILAKREISIKIVCFGCLELLLTHTLHSAHKEPLAREMKEEF